MRLSVNKGDPGYKPEIFTQQIKVFCDGERIERCVTADEEEGFVVFFTGELAKSGDCMEQATVRGKVEIRGFTLDI